MFGNAGREYMEKYGAKKEDFAEIARVKPLYRNKKKFVCLEGAHISLHQQCHCTAHSRILLLTQSPWNPPQLPYHNPALKVGTFSPASMKISQSNLKTHSMLNVIQKKKRA
jgi:hypothetical protein